ncbi:hypothetical protein [Streptomyces sp. x-80]|uniref:hypothetical protein n=1 Tax=Streptomyces sp. x-80 TaxID=2789282 RepID=UPI00397F223E
MRAAKKLTVAIAAAALAIPATSAYANSTPVKDGPGAAKVIQIFDVNWRWVPNSVALREGNSKFGRQHIAKGGSTGNTTNHELTPAAKRLWVIAMEKVDPGTHSNPFPGGTLSIAHYATPSGVKRTMCVVDDANGYVYAGKNYGPKGIITAFWVNGHKTLSGCSRD